MSYVVLYIEDNISNLKLVQRILRNRPAVQLVEAIRGGTGLAAAREWRPDLILLDMNLPDMHGRQVLSQLQADPRTSAIPIMVISADAMPDQIEEVLAAGALDYLTKPINIRSFLQLIDRMIEGNNQAAGHMH